MIVDVALLVLALGLIAANGLFVAAEFSLVTVERSRLQQLAAAGDRGARGILAAVGRLSFQLSGAQLGITVTSLLLGVIAEPALAHLLRPAAQALGLSPDAAEGAAVVVALLIATVVQMVLGELVPKNAALARPLAVARASVPPQRAFSAAFSVVIRALNGSANAIVRRLGVEPQDELASARSPEELSLLMRLSAEAGMLPAGTAAMLHRALRFGDKTAAEAMTPRVDCVTVAATSSIAALLETARRTGHLRFPVVAADDIDDIAGLAVVADAFAVPGPDRERATVAGAMRRPVLVPESLDLDTVSLRLHTARSEMAVVVDEYGGFAGIVTVEDLVEELVGEMADEYDQPEEESAEPVPTRLAPGTTVTLPGSLRADEVEERTGWAMPTGPYETLAGLVIARIGRLPEPGDRVIVDRWALTVAAKHHHRIEQVAVTAPVENASAERGEQGR